MRIERLMLVGSVGLLSVLFGFLNNADAHKHVCEHFHAGGGDSVVTCNDTTACTQDGNTGNCKSEQSTTRVWCRCTADGGDDEPGSGCNSSASWYFDDQEAGLPTSNSAIIYLTASDANNFVSTSFGGGIVGPEFGPESSAMEGTISLFFGSFSDPNNVPVTVEDVSISFIEVAGEGSNWFELPDGAFQSLIYDSVSKVIDTTDGHGIQLWLTNNLGGQLPVTVNLQGTIDPSGGLHGFAQVAVHVSVFIDGFESGNSDEWTNVNP